MTDPKEILKPENLSDFLEREEPEFEISPEEAPSAIEALLFAAGDPLPFDKIQRITGLDRSSLQSILQSMSERYQRDHHRGLLLREIDGNWILCTKPGMSVILERLFAPRHRPPLSQAAYETLAIIAYNQPVTRAQVESVRGVNSDSIISRLVERNLIEETGTLDAPGRPSLFSTSDQFLRDFGLRTVKDLPPMEMLMYGTLRDFEESLEVAAGQKKDKQLTIDQLVSAFAPHEDQEPSTQHMGPAHDLPDSEVLDVSGALFGEDSDQADGEA